jgi:mannose-6-phosphate isomerase-like protein (cupin superfamily)/DNA-binding XRE family transcriptional regulator
MLLGFPMAAGIERPLGLVLTSLGAQLKALRTQRGWTLEKLTKLSKLSEPYLSRLESGRRQPSLAALITLARVYGIPLRTLLEGDGQAMPACKIINSGSTASRISNGLAYRPVSGGGALTGLQAMEVRVPARRRDAGLYKHEGEEWLYVISGGLNLIFDNEQHALARGDAAHFDARTPHRLAAAGKRDAIVLLVASGPNPHLEISKSESPRGKPAIG